MHEVFAECGKIREMRDNPAKCVTGGNPSRGPSGPNISIFLEDHLIFFQYGRIKTSINNDFSEKQTEIILGNGNFVLLAGTVGAPIPRWWPG